MKKNKLLLFLWLTLWTMTGLIVQFKSQTNQGKYELNEIFTNTFDALIPYLISAVIIWVIVSFLAKKIPFLSINYIKIIFLWLIFFLLIFFSPYFIKKPAQNQESKKYPVNILTAINNERGKIDLPLISLDGRLCAFAKKKAIEYADGREETKTAFSNEIRSPGNNIFFSKFDKIVLDSLTEGIGQTDLELAKTFMSRKDKGASTPILTHGCVANSVGSEEGRFYTIFVGGIVEDKTKK